MISYLLGSVIFLSVVGQISTIPAQDTRCYRLRADKQVPIYGQDVAASEAVATIPPYIANDPISRMKFQAQNGFDDVDGDGVERFRFTIICRCHNETDTLMHAVQKAHLGEVDCEGRLTGGRIPYTLGIDRVGQCFVASQRHTRAATGNLSRFFLEVSPNTTLDRSRAVIDPANAYFGAGEFKLHRYTYRDVCNQDIHPYYRTSSGASGVTLRGSAKSAEEPPQLKDDGPQYAKVAYEGDRIAKTIAVA